MVLRASGGLLGAVRHHVPSAEGEEARHQGQKEVLEGGSAEETGACQGPVPPDPSRVIVKAGPASAPAVRRRPRANPTPIMSRMARTFAAVKAVWRLLPCFTPR